MRPFRKEKGDCVAIVPDYSRSERMRPTQIRSRQVASPWRAPCRIPGLRQSSANYLLQCLDAGDQPAAAAALGLGHVPDLAERSEERRVGKECRSRWSPYH